jgi:hypothetical protein
VKKLKLKGVGFLFGDKLATALESEGSLEVHVSRMATT